jgi:hypothetical protein
MADGKLCHYCGRQESAHTHLVGYIAEQEELARALNKELSETLKQDIKEAEEVWEGYPVPLVKCPGFVPEPEKQPSDTEDEEDRYGRYGEDHIGH